MAIFCGCFQTAQIYTAQHNYYQGRYDDAVQRLSSEGIPARDELLALLEKGMALQAAGRYAESADAWRAAEVLMEKQDIFHVGEQALSLLFDQNILAYQPAPYEKPFLHALLCLNYLVLHEIDPARVEALKALKNLDRREAIVGPIVFARYVAALAFEAAGDVNDAYIEYKKIHESGTVGFLPTLVRLSATLEFAEDHEHYLGELDLEEDSVSSRAPTGEELPLILFLGKSPRKVTSEVILDANLRVVLPVFQSQSNTITGARLFTASGPAQTSILLTSVETLAGRFSGRLFAGELLKEVLRHKAQKQLVKKVGDKVGSTTEKILKTVFFFAKEADLRSWSSLPAAIHLVRVPAGDDLRQAAGPWIQYTGPVEREESDSPATAPGLSLPVAMMRAW